MADENTSEKKQEHKKKPKRGPNKNYAVKRRLPVRPVDGENVIFITKKTNFKAQLDKCCDLLTKGETEIILHGLGAAIQRCCNLALQLEILFSGTCQIEVNTGTVDVVECQTCAEVNDNGGLIQKACLEWGTVRILRHRHQMCFHTNHGFFVWTSHQSMCLNPKRV